MGTRMGKCERRRLGSNSFYGDKINIQCARRIFYRPNSSKLLFNRKALSKDFLWCQGCLNFDDGVTEIRPFCLKGGRSIKFRHRDKPEIFRGADHVDSLFECRDCIPKVGPQGKIGRSQPRGCLSANRHANQAQAYWIHPRLCDVDVLAVGLLRLFDGVPPRPVRSVLRAPYDPRR